MPPSRAGRRREDRPLVSVIVPAHNAEETLCETLQSAAAQTYRKIEIVIVDDGSTDRTAEIAADFCAIEPRARLVRQNNRGLSAARNRAVRESEGLWIAPLDADDLWHPTKIEKQIGTALAARDAPGFVYCWYYDIDQDGYVLGSGPRWAFDGASLKRLAYQNTIHTALLSRDAIECVGGYDESLRACEDVMIQLQIAQRYRIAVVPEYLVGYRKRADSMSRDTDLVIRSWRKVLAQLVRDGADIPQYVLRWTEAFFRKIAAEERLVRRSYVEALGLFMSAVALDPVRWAPYGFYRIVRTARRLARGRRNKPKPIHFSSTDARESIKTDADEIPMLWELLRWIEARRVRSLGAKEALTEGCSQRAPSAERKGS